jgi:protein-S-isoprenylcysteine O-methyltransferase Ste14
MPVYETNTVTLRLSANESAAIQAVMSAAGLAFRFRIPLFILLYLLGFFPPWDFLAGSRGTLWLAASAWVARVGGIGLAAATIGVTLAALLCLVAGAILRVWGTAYLGFGVMRGAALAGDQLVAAGPYYYVRNPLYLGSWLLAVGVCILMPPSGAVFFLPAFSVYTLLLIGVEERFLTKRQGDVYLQYRRRVPRLWPRLAAGDITSSGSPRWISAFLNETYPIAITLCFALFAWHYNAHILIRCVLICYGLSLVVRAVTKRPTAEASPR